MARRIMPDYLKSEFVKIINRNYFSKEANPIREKAFNHFIVILIFSEIIGEACGT